MANGTEWPPLVPATMPVCGVLDDDQSVFSGNRHQGVLENVVRSRVAHEPNDVPPQRWLYAAQDLLHRVTITALCAYHPARFVVAAVHPHR